MEGPTTRSVFPIILKALKWVFKDYTVSDSVVFQLHHQATAFLILIGLGFSVVENYLDSDALSCIGHTCVNPSLSILSFRGK